MTRVVLKGIKKTRQKLADGTIREYHFIRGKKLPAFWHSDMGIALGSPEYLAAYEAALGIEKAALAGSGRGTLDGLVRDYMNSAQWKKLSGRTQGDYSKGLIDVQARWGKTPYQVLESPKFRNAVLNWIEKNWIGKSADHRLTPFKRVLSWGVKNRQVLALNPLNGAPLYYEGSDRDEIIWHRGELEAFLAAAYPALSRAALLMAETALRPGDLVRLTRNHIETTETGQRVINLKTNKSRRKTRVIIPLTALAAEIIDSTSTDQLLILVTATGKPWDEEHLSKEVSAVLDGLGLRSGKGGRLGVKEKGVRKGQPEHLTLYDLRGTACTRLVRAGFGLDMLAAHMGWKPSYAAKMLDIYLAQDPRIADAMILKLQPPAEPAIPAAGPAAG
ncbi:MAG TPA: tyrosine-type recombinase/integrase [Amaricoccus sp.]|uniref:tyrosine-type recombinase/integrase n=1 Tax=Amaricoccus sp. TaxID=1872485 RepID=UPI002CAD3072|nr:tyrosine-type recombinase/integrase [Amaricoccus sp.]HMQ93537.1 tyrosine-type recombinase/integrase [Amaricoccus sp.]HMR53474.1 tyrosine-type recombinase/integrase [Amaricoccus sp.]HMR58949.1 tyrosine-type recombinase/integrase [Amaricoccus sp.]HMU00468.1 tyrosine-type recombinase/integrase [Amaricoccus sp.]